MSLAELESALAGGSRENRYLLEFNLPGAVTGETRTLNVLVLSATVPGKIRGAITINKEGKTGRVAGDELTDENFETNFQVPKDAQAVYSTMNEWFELPDTADGENAYKVKIKCSQLNLQNEKTFSWEIGGAWVSTLPPVDFNSESQDTIKQFAVTFTVDTVVPIAV